MGRPRLFARKEEQIQQVNPTQNYIPLRNHAEDLQPPLPPAPIPVQREPTPEERNAQFIKQWSESHQWYQTLQIYIALDNLNETLQQALESLRSIDDNIKKSLS